MLNSKKFFATCTLMVFLILGKYAFSSHIMGGNITYECMGNGNYVFELVFYRDCGGAQVNTNSQTLKVWNHTSLTSITLPYLSSIDISPEGTNAGVNCYNCDTPNGNIGIGSIQKITYRSAPTLISGTPPANGWIFTFDDFSRNGNITNLQNPLNYGVTLTAKIFNVGASSNNCHDNSPKFLQVPHFVSCVGKPYKLNLNPVDRDLDSLHITFAQPLNNLNNLPYAEGTNPAPIPFVNGFSVNSPTPSSAMQAGNVNAIVDQQTGEITFLSTITGNFNIKIQVTSFRNKKRISEVVHEMQLIVTNCNSTNNPPVITPPFAGTYSTTVNAGDLVNFNLATTDTDLLQNGALQSVTINPSGLLFGPDPTVATGCITGPCPTVGPSAPLTGLGGSTMNFNWQTNCAHLLDASGNELDEVPYQFVFRVQDDYCPIPEVKYETVTINVKNPGVIQAPVIECIQGTGTGDFTIRWQPVANPTGTFVRYELHTVQNGLIATIPTIATNSYTHAGVTTNLNYFLKVISGCSGQASRNSDTIRNIYLNLSNVTAGTAVLDWNNPTTLPNANYGTEYEIYKEYPAGTWTLLTTVPYGTTHFEETIDVCSEFLSYRIELSATPCNFTSQINGNNFTDQTPPDIPTMNVVTIDTLTNETSISWTPSTAPDTYGYIIYMQHPVTGFLVELDTIFGQFNTTYTYNEPFTNGAITYTVAAFDSCPSPFGAPFNLSARDPNFHSTIYLQNSLYPCDGSVTLNWTAYRGWQAESYDVFVRKQGEPWQVHGNTTELNYTFIGEDLQTYEVAIRANKGDGTFSFSRKLTLLVKRIAQPAYSYLQVATVNADESSVEIKYIIDPTATVTKIALQRLNRGVFETIQEVTNPPSTYQFSDTEVDVDAFSYTYRVVFYDSCGNAGFVSNSGKSILLKTAIDQTTLKAHVQWTAYEQFNGSITGYSLFRSTDGGLNYSYVNTIAQNILSYEDDLYNLTNEGLVCYRVEALEGPNIYNLQQGSLSNNDCVLIEPTIYIPNAFMPSGVNTIFLPIIRSFEINSYELIILNRWGQVVFNTNDVSTGWNGLMDNSGKEAEAGLYNYRIELKDGNGEQIVRRGHVTLLR